MKKKTSPEEEVDVLYVTSDGRKFIDPKVAELEASKLKDTSLKLEYKDEAVREIAKAYTPLQLVVQATDILKRSKALRTGAPTYTQYKEALEEINITPIEEYLYDFIKSNVFRANRPQKLGEIDKIYTWEDGIVQAVFIRRYAQGQIFSYNDKLVMTCPTNTELASGTYQQIFNPLLGKPKTP